VDVLAEHLKDATEALQQAHACYVLLRDEQTRLSEAIRGLEEEHDGNERGLHEWQRVRDCYAQMSAAPPPPEMIQFADDRILGFLATQKGSLQRREVLQRITAQVSAGCNLANLVKQNRRAARDTIRTRVTEMKLVAQAKLAEWTRRLDVLNTLGSGSDVDEDEYE